MKAQTYYRGIMVTNRSFEAQFRHRMLDFLNGFTCGKDPNTDWSNYRKKKKKKKREKANHSIFVFSLMIPVSGAIKTSHRKDAAISLTNATFSESLTIP